MKKRFKANIFTIIFYINSDHTNFFGLIPFLLYFDPILFQFWLYTISQTFFSFTIISTIQHYKIMTKTVSKILTETQFLFWPFNLRIHPIKDRKTPKRGRLTQLTVAPFRLPDFQEPRRPRLLSSAPQFRVAFHQNRSHLRNGVHESDTTEKKRAETKPWPETRFTVAAELVQEAAGWP